MIINCEFTLYVWNNREENVYCCNKCKCLFATIIATYYSALYKDLLIYSNINYNFVGLLV